MRVKGIKGSRVLGIRCVFIFLCLLAASAAQAQGYSDGLFTLKSQFIRKELAKGVTLDQNIMQYTNSGWNNPATIKFGNNSGGTQIINTLTIDPKAPGVKIQAVLAQDKIYTEDSTKGRETVSSIAKRLNAVAVVNADFFPIQSNCPGDVLNLHISGGELMSEPMPNRVVFGITSDNKFLFDRLELDARITLPDGKWFPIRGINRPRHQHELVAYTSRFAASTGTSSAGSEVIITTQDLPVKVGVPIKGTVSEAKPSCGDTSIPEGAIVLSGVGTGDKFVQKNLKPGTTVTIEFKLKPTKTTGWEKVVEAVGGGPWLVKDGKVNVDAKEQGFQTGFYAGVHPRTALGVTADGKLIIVTVDGRQTLGSGINLNDLAAYMRNRRCVEAINLDGGGSTTMATSFGLLNSPSEGSERLIANALVVFGEAPSSEPTTEFSIKPLDGPILSGTIVNLLFSGPIDRTAGCIIIGNLRERAVWASSGGAGFVDQSGRFYALKPRKGTISVKIGSQVMNVPVEVVPGPVAKLTAKLEADPSGAPNRSVLNVTATDVNGNAVKDGQISVKVDGGTPDLADLTTDGNGKATTGITWDDASQTPAQVTITSGNLPPVTLPRLK